MAVQPFLSSASAHAPASSKSTMSVSRPNMHAAINGVTRSLSALLTSALLLRSVRTTRADASLGHLHAASSGVVPSALAAFSAAS
eukprot:3937981-Rhodomonas_salina.1